MHWTDHHLATAGLAWVMALVATWLLASKPEVDSSGMEETLRRSGCQRSMSSKHASLSLLNDKAEFIQL